MIYLVIVSAALAALFLGLVYRRLDKWRAAVAERLDAGSLVAQTERGPIEYAMVGTGPVVLALHGSPGGYDQMLGFRHGLAEAGFTLLSPSRPGYLRTPIEAGQSFAAQADAMVALLDRLGIDRVAVMGISGGAPVAIEMALRYSERVWALVLISAVTFPMPVSRGELWFSRAPAWASDSFIRLWQNFIDKRPDWMAQGQTKFLPAEVRERYLAQLAGDASVADEFWSTLGAVMMGLAHMTRRKRGARNDYAQLERLPRYPLEKLQCPALVMHGIRDHAVPFEQARLFVESAPQATLASFDGGHFDLGLGPYTSDVRAAQLTFLRRHCPVEHGSGNTPAGDERQAR
jgi:pimeloyl-ACP methyl ester carboxylesterase